MLWTECLGLLWVFGPLLSGHLAGATRIEIHIPVRRSFEFICDVVCYGVMLYEVTILCAIVEYPALLHTQLGPKKRSSKEKDH